MRTAQARAAQDWMLEHRRHLHRHPEVGLDLPQTHDYVASVLGDLGYPVETHPAAGVTAPVAGTAPDGVTSILRADMDALPVMERTELAFRSLHDDAMHACGHDMHMAMLLGAAKVLAEHPPRRDTVLVFQPGEEADRGALEVLKHDNLAVPGPANAFAVHVNAVAPPGAILLRPGVFMAHGDWFSIDLTGPGGHASQPHLVGNPVEAAADIAIGLRKLVAEISPGEPLVATITESRIGNTVNVIPAAGQLRGTIRALTSTTRIALLDGMRHLVVEVAQQHRLAGQLTIHEGYPAVINDSEYITRLSQRLNQTDLAANVTSMAHPSMVIEDFAYFLRRWPGAMVYLGACAPGNVSFNHADDVVYDESALSVGAALHLLAADGF